MVGIRTEFGQEESAKLAVIELAVSALGALAVGGPHGKLNANERVEMRQCLMDALEVLNNEKETYDGP